MIAEKEIVLGVPKVLYEKKIHSDIRNQKLGKVKGVGRLKIF